MINIPCSTLWSQDNSWATGFEHEASWLQSSWTEPGNTKQHKTIPRSNALKVGAGSLGSISDHTVSWADFQGASTQNACPKTTLRLYFSGRGKRYLMSVIHLVSRVHQLSCWVWGEAAELGGFTPGVTKASDGLCRIRAFLLAMDNSRCCRRNLRGWIEKDPSGRDFPASSWLRFRGF